MSVVETDFNGNADVVVIGAGIIGTACAARLANKGLSVVLVDRGSLCAGTTAAGEGNLLTSDKIPGAELELARWSLDLWRQLASRLGGEIEFEHKGGLVVAADDKAHAGLLDFAAAQRRAGVHSEPVSGHELSELEPHLTRDARGGVWYPGDCQVQPMAAAAALLRANPSPRFVSNQEVVRIEAMGSGARVRTRASHVDTGFVVNAAGPWSGQVAAVAGGRLDIQPRHGVIVVTEPCVEIVRHKVYEASYVAATQSHDPRVQHSAVIEGTPSGPVLIGSSREQRGFDASISLGVVRALAARAVRLIPSMGRVRAMRAYGGFRPGSPDRIPIIGPDPKWPWLIHATGHEGAGIGLAPATAALVDHHIAATPVPVSPDPFDPGRFR